MTADKTMINANILNVFPRDRQHILITSICTVSVTHNTGGFFFTNLLMDTCFGSNCDP